MNGTPTETEIVSIGGLDGLVLTEHDDDRTVNTGPCDPPDVDEPCITIWTTDDQAWYSPASSEDAAAIDYFFEDAGVLFAINSLGDDTIEDVANEIQPLPDSITITPAG